MVVKFFSTTAPAKIILSGLHSVVYGKPAVTTSLSLVAKAQIRPTKDNGFLLTSKNLNSQSRYTINQIVDFGQRVSQAHKRFLENGDYPAFKKLLNADANSLLILTVWVYQQKYSVDSGFELNVDSQIPVGGGLGSGAAVSSACMQALAKLFETDLSLEELNQMVNQTDQFLHGRASGIDNTTVVYGGTLRFWREDGRLEFERLMVKTAFPKMLLVDSGDSVENTGELVALVRSKFDSDSHIRKVVDQMGDLTKEFVSRLETGKSAIDIFQQDQRNLEKLGVVGQRANAMVREIESIGGVAKISGAGGVRSGSGILLAHHKDLDKLQSLVNENEWKSWEVELGE